MTLEASLFVIKFLNPSIPKDVCLMWSFLEHILSFGIRSCPQCLTDMFGPVSFYLLDSCFQYFQIVNHKKFSTGRLNIYSFFLEPIDRKLLFSCLSWTAESSFLRAEQTKLLQFPSPTKHVPTLWAIIGTLNCAFYHLDLNFFCSNFLSYSGKKNDDG